MIGNFFDWLIFSRWDVAEFLLPVHDWVEKNIGGALEPLLVWFIYTRHRRVKT